MNGAGNFSFVSVLSGISKTLGVAREVIPLWQQTKPLISNMRTAYTLIKNVNTKNSTVSNRNNKANETIKKQLQQKTIIKANNSPQFFI